MSTEFLSWFMFGYYAFALGVGIIVGLYVNGSRRPPAPKKSVEFWELADRIIRVETIEADGFVSHEFYVERGPDLTFEQAAKFITESCAELSARGITCIAHYIPGSEETP